MEKRVYKLLMVWILLLVSIVSLSLISFYLSKMIYSKHHYNLILGDEEIRIEDYINANMTRVKNISTWEEIQESISYSDKNDRINNKLSIVNRSLGSSLIYILNSKGDVLYSSNYLTEPKIIGNNYSFRKYFSDAIIGLDNVMIAQGVTTHKRGVYFGTPIVYREKIEGVLVVKKRFDFIDKVIDKSPVYSDLISNTNEIFSSKNDNWILKDKSQVDQLDVNNMIQKSLFLKGWTLRMIYGRDDLISLPPLYFSIILFCQTLFFLILSAILLLIYINKKKNSAEIDLISRRKEIIKINARLEEKIKERTEELKYTQRRLVESEKMAALGNLIAGVSHEINTPIGVALMASTHLRTMINELIENKATYENKSIEDLQESINMVINNIQKSSEIIRTFKQVTGETIVEDPQLLNIKDHINETILSIGLTNNEKGPKLIINCSEDIYFSTYPMAFYHIFSNLINNSLKHAFSHKEGEKIEITINTSENQLMLIYQDNGKGMEEESKKKIFDPFYTTQRGHGGTGLGMNIVYNIIVKLFKGDINCTSKPGKGTTFDIYLSPIE